VAGQSWVLIKSFTEKVGSALVGCFKNLEGLNLLVYNGIAVTSAERLQFNGTSSSLEPADVRLDVAAANDDDSSDDSEKMTRSKRRKRTRVTR